eukprot:TRINITY_DN13736_c0_g1_i3.p3 TRINITY_DN13736_c0_g1~~TRINITY_DN13736_c0_g1_i3.p3  ORF type:complete len:126 (-),score=16.35 TRINITY_DN13736_c0_g1_i3:490-867(-)
MIGVQRVKFSSDYVRDLWDNCESMKVACNELNSQIDLLRFFAGKKRGLSAEFLWDGEDMEDLIYDLLSWIEKGSYACMISTTAMREVMGSGCLTLDYKHKLYCAIKKIKEEWEKIDLQFRKTYFE